jgi:hypothetical protein
MTIGTRTTHLLVLADEMTVVTLSLSLSTLPPVVAIVEIATAAVNVVSLMHVHVEFSTLLSSEQLNVSELDADVAHDVSQHSRAHAQLPHRAQSRAVVVYKVVIVFVVTVVPVLDDAGIVVFVVIVLTVLDDAGIVVVERHALMSARGTERINDSANDDAKANLPTSTLEETLSKRNTV